MPCITPVSSLTWHNVALENPPCSIGQKNIDSLKSWWKISSQSRAPQALWFAQFQIQSAKGHLVDTVEVILVVITVDGCKKKPINHGMEPPYQQVSRIRISEASTVYRSIEQNSSFRSLATKKHQGKIVLASHHHMQCRLGLVMMLSFTPGSPGSVAKTRPFTANLPFGSIYLCHLFWP